MTILDKILANKRQEVARRQELKPIAALKESVHFSAPTLSLRTYLSREGALGIIAEIKRQSPSKGQLRSDLDVEEISISYMQHGASALSVLTDAKFFGGSLDDLQTARFFNLCPILCKDFVVDEYQIYEARSYGADVILLIAAALDSEALERLCLLAHELSMEVLVEVHSEDEIAGLPGVAFDHYGVNSRDLRDFTVDLDRAMALARLLPEGSSKIAESGIDAPEKLVRLKQAGFNGFLIGEYFMKANFPGRACGKLIAESTKLLA